MDLNTEHPDPFRDAMQGGSTGPSRSARSR